ncbi:MAG: AI-2E family transporter [Acidimicrobiales bacterium]
MENRRTVDVRHVAGTTLVAVSVVFLAIGTRWRTIGLWRIVSCGPLLHGRAHPGFDLLQHRARVRRGRHPLPVRLRLARRDGHAFVRPLVDQGRKFADNLPEMIDDARAARGRSASTSIATTSTSATRTTARPSRTSSPRPAARSLSIAPARSSRASSPPSSPSSSSRSLLLLGGPDLSQTTLAVVPERHRELARPGGLRYRAVSGYMFGNVVISVLAGIAAYVFLRIAGVPYAEVLALWVAFADLIPLVGATLGAVPRSPWRSSTGRPRHRRHRLLHPLPAVREQRPAGHRDVEDGQLNPLGVLVSVLIGVEIFEAARRPAGHPRRRGHPGGGARPLERARGSVQGRADRRGLRDPDRRRAGGPVAGRPSSSSPARRRRPRSPRAR